MLASPAYRRSPGTIFSELGSDVVALHLDRGKCYGMENVTAEVWRALATPVTLEALCAQLQDRFDVEPDQCRREIAHLLKDLQTEGLVESVG